MDDISREAVPGLPAEAPVGEGRKVQEADEQRSRGPHPLSPSPRRTAPMPADHERRDPEDREPLPEPRPQAEPAGEAVSPAGPADAPGRAPLPEVPAIADEDHLAGVLHALLLSAREGTTVLRLAQACDTGQKQVRAGLDRLAERLEASGLPVEIATAGDHVRLLTRPEVFPYLQRLRGVKRTERLSPASLETLAVIAYRQPVIRAEIEAIRGVKAGPVLRSLLDHKLIKVLGRADVPGRPLQYGTTQHFLERFGLTSLKDLPSIREFKQLG